MEDEDDVPLMEELVPPGELTPEEEEQFIEQCAKVDNALSVVADFLYNHGREWKVDSKPGHLFEKVALQAVYFREMGMMDKEFASSAQAVASGDVLVVFWHTTALAVKPESRD